MRLDVAAQLPLEFLCPPQVHEELAAGVRVGHLTVEPEWLRVVERSTPPPVLVRAAIDVGEAAVLQLAVEQGVGWVWENPRAGEFSVDVYASANPTNVIAEFDETNNTRLAIVPLYIMLGDVSANGAVGMKDIDLFVAVLLGLDTNSYRVAASDMNADGSVNGLDVQPLVSALLAG